MYPALISPLAIAPMIDWTYTHFRVFMRMLAPNALLYTDMQTPGAIINRPDRALELHPDEFPLALQLGGSDINALVECAIKAEQRGYQEINLNLGCPSDRVQAGQFGACLMAEPLLVKTCIQAMKQAVNIPVTAKTRIGIDQQDSYAFFANFVKHVMDAGCDKLIVHARKAWLKGLSPKQNRTVPPINYDFVYRIKQQYPEIPIVANGNIQSIAEIKNHLQHVDGVMLGRLACQNPYAIAEIHHAMYSEIPLVSRYTALKNYAIYAKQAVSQKQIATSLLLKPIMNMAHALPNAEVWKEHLMTIQRTAKIELLNELIDMIFKGESMMIG